MSPALSFPQPEDREGCVGFAAASSSAALLGGELIAKVWDELVPGEN